MSDDTSPDPPVGVVVQNGPQPVPQAAVLLQNNSLSQSSTSAKPKRSKKRVKSSTSANERRTRLSRPTEKNGSAMLDRGSSATAYGVLGNDDPPSVDRGNFPIDQNGGDAQAVVIGHTDTHDTSVLVDGQPKGHTGNTETTNRSDHLDLFDVFTSAIEDLQQQIIQSKTDSKTEYQSDQVAGSAVVYPTLDPSNERTPLLATDSVLSVATHETNQSQLAHFSPTTSSNSSVSSLALFGGTIGKTTEPNNNNRGFVDCEIQRSGHSSTPVDPNHHRCLALDCCVRDRAQSVSGHSERRHPPSLMGQSSMLSDVSRTDEGSFRTAPSHVSGITQVRALPAPDKPNAGLVPPYMRNRATFHEVNGQRYQVGISFANEQAKYAKQANRIAEQHPEGPFENSFDTTDSVDSKPAKNTFYSVTMPRLKYIKVFLLASLIIYTLISFIFIQEKEEKWTNVAVKDKIPAFVDLSHSLDLMFPVWKLRARGSFLPNEYANLTNFSVVFTIVQLLNDSRGGHDNGAYRVVKRPWAAPIAPYKLGQYLNPKEVEHIFKLSRGDAYDHVHRYQLRIDTNSEESVALTVNMGGFSELSADGIILAATVLIFLYTLIIFEIVNRTLAAMLGATAAITCLTLIRDRPSLEKVVSWLDVETLCLLFGMMIMVAILCETGFFDYIAVIAFRLAKGRTWPLIFTLCFFTGVMSAFLDNVTTILLMTPVTIRLCEIKNIDPKHVLISQVIFSNIGGAATPVGDPPNVIIISSSKVQQQGIDFGRFTAHMMPGIIISFIATLIYIRIYYRDLSHLEFQESSSLMDDDTEDSLKEFKKEQSRYLSSRDSSNQYTNDADSESTIKNVKSESSYGKSGQYGSVASTIKPGQFLNSSSELEDSWKKQQTTWSHSHQHYHHGQPGLKSRGRNVSIGGVMYSENDLEHHHAAISTSNPLKRCSSCNNLEEFCSGTSHHDRMFDEKRVFRSSDELKREIEVWKRACSSIAGYSRDENSVRMVLNRKVEVLETILQEHCYETVPPEDNYRSVLAELEEKYKIRDRPLLIKSGIVMFIVISLFFMQSIPNLDLSLGWIAILGAILLLVLSDRHELESIMGRVEWSTLIFFAALFVVMEALAELKFLWWIGRLTQDFINSVPEQHRLVVAITVFIWISALSSSFIDNIPLTTVMVKIIEDLAENNEFNIPLVPLIYALAFGACLGGNGTLIGASSNVVCAGVAEQHGYRFTFMDFFRVGFPIMLITVALSTIYLIVCHVMFKWNY